MKKDYDSIEREIYEKECQIDDLKQEIEELKKALE